MKKLTIVVHKFMDIEGREMPKGFVEKLRNNELFSYRDTVLKEHFYSLDTLLEKMEEEKNFFTTEEKKMVRRLRKICDEKDIGYFRFVFN